MKLPSSFVVYDFETTGLDVQACSVTEICAVRYDRGIETARLDCLIRLPFKLPEKIIELTGITDVMLDESGIDEKDAFRMLGALQEGACLVGHNITRYDNHILSRLLRQHGHANTTNTYSLDTAALFKASLLKLPPRADEPLVEFQQRILRIMSPVKYSLSLCYKSLTGQEPNGAHRAKGDVEMIQAVLPHLMVGYEAYFNGHTLT